MPGCTTADKFPILSTILVTMLHSHVRVYMYKLHVALSRRLPARFAPSFHSRRALAIQTPPLPQIMVAVQQRAIVDFKIADDADIQWPLDLQNQPAIDPAYRDLYDWDRIQPDIFQQSTTTITQNIIWTFNYTGMHPLHSSATCPPTLPT